jgi:4-hydroxy-2-oxoheptanedioate aldolase
VKNIEDILSVPGIGVLFVGPNDLSWSLGVPQGSPEHETAVQTVLKACMARNIPAAITVTEADVVRRLTEGFRIASLPGGELEPPMDATLKLARTVIQR